MDKVDNKLVTLVLFFFLAFGFFTVSVLSQRGLKIQASKNVVPSASTSLLLAFPLSLKIGEQSTINCVARDADGNSAPNKSCSLAATCGTVSPASAQTNTNGIAQFTVTSNEPCIAQLSATIDGSIQVSQTASVQFISQ